jgi:thiosulfate/3-mercaptopyruvate sulfurtransferase
MENIYILNGGLPKWKAENLPLETTSAKSNFPHSKADFFFKYKVANKMEVTDLKRVQEASFLAKNNKGVYEILDARGEPRFLGKEPEPRGFFFTK